MFNHRRPALYVLAVAALLSPPATLYAQSGSRESTLQRANNAKGVAVVELFTSQGCSSCPPADVVLGQIAERAQKSNLPVYVLSFHVDYWNQLGWTDPYSEQQYSQRQRAYANAMGSNRVYTPQMIVNGSTEFVGSNNAKAQAAVTRSLARASEVTISATAKYNDSGRTISLDYRLAGRTRGRWLNIALVETPDANSVPRGENAGRKLSHVNVVRVFRAMPIEGDKTKLTISVPEDLDDTEMRLIAYVQDPKTLAVVGATELSNFNP